MKVRKVSFASDRLSELANGSAKTWAIGYQDECWWSRVALPSLHSFSAPGEPVRLIEQSVGKDDPHSRLLLRALYAASQSNVDTLCGGASGQWDNHPVHNLLFANQKSLAQCHGDQVDSRQAQVVEADRLLDDHELAERVCAVFGCPHYEHLYITKNVA